MNFKNIPIYIISYNRISYLKSIISFLEKKQYFNIHIIDNASTYPPLLKYYGETRYPVHKMDKNYGHMVFWETHDKFRKIYQNEYYVLTDPDVLPDDDCPDDFIEVFYNVLRNYPDISKAGFSLRTDDIPDCYKLKSHVVSWEKQFCQKVLSAPSFPFDLFDASIDTTFALYRPQKRRHVIGDQFLSAIRVGAPYIARHLPWYADENRLTEEDVFYKETISEKSGTWNYNLSTDGIDSRLGNFPEPDEFENRREKIYQTSIDLSKTNDSHVIAYNYIKNGSVVFDIGCACGDFGQELKLNKGCAVYGVEYNSGSIKIAESKNVYTEIFHLDLNAFDDRGLSHLVGKFDYIVFGDVLEHLIDPEAVVNSFRKYLNPDGHFIVSLPNIAHASIKADLLCNNFFYTEVGILDKTHIRFFTAGSICRFFSKAGLEIEDAKVTAAPVDAFQSDESLFSLPFFVQRKILNDFHSYVCQYVMLIKASRMTPLALYSVNRNKMILDRNNVPDYLLKCRKHMRIKYLFPFRYVYQFCCLMKAHMSKDLKDRLKRLLKCSQ